MFEQRLKSMSALCMITATFTLVGCEDSLQITNADTGTNNSANDATVATDSDSTTRDDIGQPTDTHSPTDTDTNDVNQPTDSGQPDTRKLLTLSNLRAFPTAEGAGAGATGGRGGKVIYVTTRDNAGPGSLREALRTKGSRTIVFAIGGRFQLESLLYVEDLGDFTLAGQTANDLGGIHLTSEGTANDNYMYIVDSQNMIFRYFDTRHQWEWFLIPNNSHRRASFNTASCYNYIIDHVSSGWGSYSFNVVDPNKEANAIGKFTLQRSLAHENIIGQNVGMGAGVSAGYASSFPHDQQIDVWNRIEELDFHHNAWIGQTHRFPNTDGGANGRFRVINNYVYGWGSRLNNIGGNARNDIIANVYQKARHTSEIEPARMHVIDFNSNLSMPSPPPRMPNILIKDNLVLENSGEVHALTTNDNWNMMSHWMDSSYGTEYTMLDRKYQRNTPIPDSQHPITIHPADTIKDNVLSNVGANVRFHEDGTTYIADPIDQMYIDWAVKREGPTRSSTAIGDGGLGDPSRFVYPNYESKSRDLDTWDADRDGMPNAWEILHGLDPNNPDDRNDTKLDWEFNRYRVRNDAGYTNLEIYLAETAGDFHMLANE